MSDTSYPTIIESANRFGYLWNAWNYGEISAEDVLLLLEKEKCFIEGICRDLSERIDTPYEKLLEINLKTNLLENWEPTWINDSSPTTMKPVGKEMDLPGQVNFQKEGNE